MTPNPTPGEPVTIVIGERRYDGVVVQVVPGGRIRVLTGLATVRTVPLSAVERRGVVV